MKQLTSQRLVDRLTSDELQEAFRDLWGVYDAFFDEIQAETDHVTQESPQIQALAAMIPEEEIAAQAAQDRAMIQKAMCHGLWDPYLQHLRMRGVELATLGLPYESLYELTASFRDILIPQLIASFGQEPGRLSGVLLALATFVDLGMSVVGKSYLDQKQALLEQSEDRLNMLVNSDVIGFFAWDDSGRITQSNQAFRDLFGFSKDSSLSNLSWERLLPPKAKEQPPHLQLASKSQLKSREIYLVHQSGVEFPCLFGAAGLQEGKSSGMGFLLDLSVHKRAQELEEQNDRIAEANRLKSEFLANMSHELRTPLNSIIGFASLMFNGKVGELAPMHKEFVGDILNGGRHLLRLINDILDLSKVEAGKMEFFPEPVDLHMIAKQVYDILKELAHKQRVSLELSIADDLPQVIVDPVRFKQVLYNFLSNAIKFSHRESSVWLRISAIDDGHFRVEVEDQGSGIPPEQLALLFSEFQQLHSGKEKRHEGTGLGLALTKRIIDAMGGRVGVASTPGQGSTFYAILPLVCRAKNNPGTPAMMGFSPMLHPSKDAPHILVVEDDPRERRWLLNALNQSGYAVQSAATGDEAIRLSRLHHFDAISLDLILPDLDGFEVLQQIRHDSLHPEVPVLIFSIIGAEKAARSRAVSGVLSAPLHPYAVIDKTKDGAETLIQQVNLLFQGEQGR